MTLDGSSSPTRTCRVLALPSVPVVPECVRMLCAVPMARYQVHRGDVEVVVGVLGRRRARAALCSAAVLATGLWTRGQGWQHRQTAPPLCAAALRGRRQNALSAPGRRPRFWQVARFSARPALPSAPSTWPLRWRGRSTRSGSPPSPCVWRGLRFCWRGGFDWRDCILVGAGARGRPTPRDSDHTQHRSGYRARQ